MIETSDNDFYRSLSVRLAPSNHNRLCVDCHFLDPKPQNKCPISIVMLAERQKLTGEKDN